MLLYIREDRWIFDKSIVTDNVNFSFKYIEGESIILNLDMLGIAVSTGSACTSGSVQESYVLKAMGIDDTAARGAVRFSLGIDNNDTDIDYCLQVIPDIVKHLRTVD